MQRRNARLLRFTTNWPAAGISGLTGDEWCIPLTRGYVALIDEEDCGLDQNPWIAMVGRPNDPTGAFYAGRQKTIRGNPQCIYMHRVISKPGPKQEVDHRDRHVYAPYKIVDNRRHNLRNLTKTLNNANARKAPACSSRFKGVSWNKRRSLWAAYIVPAGKQRHLGLFNNEIDAARAYDTAHEATWPGITEGMNRSMFPEIFCLTPIADSTTLPQ